MTCQLLAVAPEDAARLRKRPSGIEALLAAPPPGGDPLAGVVALMEQLPAAERAQARAQLDAIRGLPGLGGVQKRAGPRPADRLDLGKGWHGVHWLLCGAVDADGSAPGDAVMGGTELGPDLGYGPARIRAPEEVAPIALALAAISEEALRARYDGGAMDRAGLYPGAFATDPSWPGEVVARALAVRAFYTRAAAAGHAVVSVLS